VSGIATTFYFFDPLQSVTSEKIAANGQRRERTAPRFNAGRGKAGLPQTQSVRGALSGQQIGKAREIASQRVFRYPTV
jgi:hypothetical protein